MLHTHTHEELKKTPSRKHRQGKESGLLQDYKELCTGKERRAWGRLAGHRGGMQTVLFYRNVVGRGLTEKPHTSVDRMLTGDHLNNTVIQDCWSQ